MPQKTELPPRAGAALPPTESGAGENPALAALYARKSMRVFTGEPVAPAQKAAILRAAFEAPTAGCQQLYTILDITDPALKRRLADLCDHQDFVAQAPMVLVFLADCFRWCEIYRAAGLAPRAAGAGDLMLAAADACIAAQNCVAAAEALGLGSCYIGDILENCEQVRAALELPDTVVPAAMLVFGRPTAQQRARRKPARLAPEYVVCENRYRRRPPEDWRAALTEQAARRGEARYDFDADVAAFCRRKYESDFSREMTRSAAAYWRAFAPEEE
jgi:nitroreductase